HVVRVEPELVEHATGDVVEHVVQRLRLVVEGGDGREHDGAGSADGEQVLQVDVAQRRLPGQQHQRAALVEDDVGGAGDEVVGQPVRDGGDGTHAARRDDHAVDAERPAGQRRCLVADLVDDIGHRADVVDRVRRLVFDGAPAPLADHQVGLDVHGSQALQDPDPEHRAGGTGHADGDPGTSFAHGPSFIDAG